MVRMLRSMHNFCMRKNFGISQVGEGLKEGYKQLSINSGLILRK